MKTSNLLSIKNIFVASVLVLVACTEEPEKLTLPDASNFVAPSFVSPSTSTSKIFLPENESDNYETFKWKIADYGISVSVKYEIEVDDNEDFSSVETLIAVEGNSLANEREVAVTVKQMNDAMLKLGLPGFEEATVFLRVRSVMNGIENDPLFSTPIERTATTYQSSECGNFCTIGIIGNATPGGWDNDTDMRLQDPEKIDKSTWTVTLYLLGGNAVKFRASDSWDTNWGSGAFPNGTGTQGGADIPVSTSGYYKITFNDESGEYSFTALSGTTFASIGLIGEQSGWGADIGDLTQDPNDEHVWTGTIALTAGELKFRAEDDWANNWGAATYPSGYGIGGGPNIAIPTDGTYFVYFNDATGEYFFGPVANKDPFVALGVIGSATDGGWDSDTDLIKDPANPFKWSKTITIGDGEAKFRADNDWAVNWGASTFPGGVGVQNGANIAAAAGTYFITFNTLTGEYYFLK